MFWGKFFTGVYANVTRRCRHPEIPRWRTRYQGDLSGCSNVLGHARSTFPVSIFDFGQEQRCKPEVETVTQTGSTNKLATETDIDAISVAMQT